jgi:hypothetical protein
MTRKLSLAALLVFFSVAVPARADNVQLQGLPSPTDPKTGLSISPYSALVDGNPVLVFCVDIATPVANNASWTATSTPLTSPDYSNTLQFALTGSNATTQDNYLEMAWLIEQMEGALAADDITTAAEDQWAIWSFTGGGDPYGTNASLLASAQSAVGGGFSVSDWQILTADAGQTGQEFLVTSVPEPGSSQLLAVGLLLAGLVIKIRK